MNFTKAITTDKTSSSISLAKGSAYMVGARLIVMTLGLVTHLINARLLGPRTYGVFSLFISAVMVISGVETGLSSAITKYASHFFARSDNQGLFSLIKSSFICELLLSLMSFVTLIVVFKRVELFSHSSGTYIFLFVAILLNAYLSFSGSLIVGLKKLKEISAIQAIQSFFYLLMLVITLVGFRLKLYGSLFSFVFAMIVASAATFYITGDLLVESIRIRRRLMLKRVIYFAIPVTIASFLNTLVISGGTLVFKYLTGDLLHLGYFAVLITLGNRVRQLFLALSKATFPYISSWRAVGHKRKVQQLLLFLTLGLLVTTIAGTTLIRHFGQVAVSFLYGEKYSPIYKYLTLAFVAYMLASYKDLLAIILNATGKPYHNLMAMSTSFAVYAIALFLAKGHLTLIGTLLVAIGVCNAIYSLQALLSIWRCKIV